MNFSFWGIIEFLWVVICLFHSIRVNLVHIQEIVNLCGVLLYVMLYRGAIGLEYSFKREWFKLGKMWVMRRNWRMWNVGRSLGSTSDGVRNKEVTFVEVLWRNQQVEEVIYIWRIERRHKETLSCPFPIYSSLRSIKSSTPPLCLMHSCLRSYASQWF